MTALRACTQGDVGVTRTVTLQGVANLNTVASIITRVSRGALNDTLTTTVDDATACTIEIELGTAPTDWLPGAPEKGQWELEYQVTFADGTVLTWPDTLAKDTIWVNRQIG